MKTDKRLNAGAIKSAALSREKALIKYYEDPNKCLQCQAVIRVPDNRKVAEVRVKKFCSQSCAATYSNTASPKRKAVTTSDCLDCGTAIKYRRTSMGRLIARKYCDTCLPKTKVRLRGLVSIQDRTKGELFSHRANWQSARGSIATAARAVYIKSGKPFACEVCGYNNHVDVCHKKPVSDFADEAKIAEVNALGNLMPLCPNHHWELDNSHLSLTSYCNDLNHTIDEK